MPRTRFASLVALALLVSAVPSAAQPAGSQIPQLVRTGQKILVVDDQGRSLDGKIANLNADSFELMVKGRPVNVEFDRVVRIDHPRDGLGNGALIGMGTFIGMGFISQLSLQSHCSSESYCEGISFPVMLWITGSMAAFGAGIGVGIDALIHRKNSSIYRRGATARVSPLLEPGTGVRGAAVSVRW